MHAVESQLPHLAQITHLSEELGVHIICSVGHHHLCALSCKRIDNVAAEESCAAKDCCCDSADLHGKRSSKSALNAHLTSRYCTVPTWPCMEGAV